MSIPAEVINALITDPKANSLRETAIIVWMRDPHYSSNELRTARVLPLVRYGVENGLKVPQYAIAVRELFRLENRVFSTDLIDLVASSRDWQELLAVIVNSAGFETANGIFGAKYSAPNLRIFTRIYDLVGGFYQIEIPGISIPIQRAFFDSMREKQRKIYELEMQLDELKSTH